MALSQFQKHDQNSTEDQKIAVLSSAYDHVLTRINAQKSGFRELANRVLAWITCAKRPLTTFELRHALGVEPGEPHLDDDNLPEIEDMVSVCAGLVTVDVESDTIRLVHYTAQEFLERTQSRWFPDAESDMASVCATYLSFSAFGKWPHQTRWEFRKGLKDYPLYDYAAKHMGYHARVTPTLLKEVMDFLDGQQVEPAYSLGNGIRLAPLRPPPTGFATGHATGLHFAASHGLYQAARCLLDKGHSPDAGDNDGATPLLVAAREGHADVAQLLLDTKQVDVNIKTRMRHKTPLSLAAERGHIAVLRLLLGKETIDIDPWDNMGRTPLGDAVAGGQKEVVELLLEKGANVMAVETPRSTALHLAVIVGDVPIVEQILENGANIMEARNGAGLTPLQVAAQYAKLEVVTALLEHGADAMARDNEGHTPLHLAAQYGRLETGQLPIAKERRRKPSPVIRNARHPLWQPRKARRSAVVRALLVNSHVDPNATDASGSTPLLHATYSGLLTTVQALLEDASVDPALPDRYGTTPLSIGARHGYTAIVEALLATRRVDPAAQDQRDRSPLWWAAVGGHHDSAALLREALEAAGLDIPPLDHLAGVAEETGFGRWCDTCTWGIVRGEDYYHCGICRNNDFDVCEACYLLGERCLDPLHDLILRTGSKQATDHVTQGSTI